MTPEAAKALTQAVDAAVEQVSALTSDTPSITGDSLGEPLRLHAAGLLNAMVTYLLIPVWHEHPNLAPKGPDPPEIHFSCHRTKPSGH